MEIYWSAPAKINHFLHITGRREDGYHLLQTLFQFLDVSDELAFEVRKDGGIKRVTALAGVTEQEDITLRAATALQQHSGTSLGVDIDLRKNLPIGGGLGGGSSDAATTLLVLNHLWGLNLALEDLAVIGLKLGADVPVFIQGRAAWAEGVGEKLTPYDKLSEHYFALIIPPVSISTAEIFQVKELTRDCKVLKFSALALADCVNVCESVVREKYPLVDEVFDWLARNTMNINTRLSGTGSSIFTQTDTRAAAEDIIARLPKQWSGFVAKGLNKSPLHQQLETCYGAIT